MSTLSHHDDEISAILNYPGTRNGGDYNNVRKSPAGSFHGSRHSVNSGEFTDRSPAQSLHSRSPSQGGRAENGQRGQQNGGSGLDYADNGDSRLTAENQNGHRSSSADGVDRNSRRSLFGGSQSDAASVADLQNGRDTLDGKQDGRLGGSLRGSTRSLVEDCGRSELDVDVTQTGDKTHMLPSKHFSQINPSHATK